MTALPAWDVASDADLAHLAAAGDRQAFACIYDRYADRLHDFCIGMVRDRDAAADCVQDVFCIAATQLGKLRDPDKLRPWLYATARNEALRCIRRRHREHVVDELPEPASGEAGPDTVAARSELAELVADAAGGLSERDRSVLDLTYRHGLDGPELAQALGVSPSNATKMVFRLRETVERSLGALLVARRAQHSPDGCPELGAILADWDGRFTILMRKRIARHIESCPACDEQRRRLVNPVALLGGAPLFIPVPSWLRTQTLGQIQLTAAEHALVGSPQSRQVGIRRAARYVGSDRCGGPGDAVAVPPGQRRHPDQPDDESADYRDDEIPTAAGDCQQPTAAGPTEVVDATACGDSAAELCADPGLHTAAGRHAEYCGAGCTATAGFAGAAGAATTTGLAAGPAAGATAVASAATTGLTATARAVFAATTTGSATTTGAAPDTAQPGRAPGRGTAPATWPAVKKTSQEVSGARAVAALIGESSHHPRTRHE